MNRTKRYRVQSWLSRIVLRAARYASALIAAHFERSAKKNMRIERPSLRRVSFATGLALILTSLSLFLISDPIALLYIPVTLSLSTGFLVTAYILRWIRAVQKYRSTGKKINQQKKKDLYEIIKQCSPSLHT